MRLPPTDENIKVLEGVRPEALERVSRCRALLLVLRLEIKWERRRRKKIREMEEMEKQSARQYLTTR